MTTWGIFWICLFSCIAFTSVVTDFVRYRSLKMMIKHNVKIDKGQINNMFNDY